MSEKQDRPYNPLDPIEVHKIIIRTIISFMIAGLIMIVLMAGNEIGKIAVARYKHLLKVESQQKKIGYRIPNVIKIYPCVQGNDGSTSTIALCILNENDVTSCSICVPVEDMAFFIETKPHKNRGI